MLNDELPDLVPVRSMARRLCVERDWLHAELEAGRLPGVRAGKTFLVCPAAIMRVLVERAKLALVRPEASRQKDGAL